MTFDQFRRLRDLICDHCGIWFDPSTAFLLEGRLQDRLVHHHLEDFQDYYFLLRYAEEGPEELDYVVDVISTKETYFFREPRQLELLRARLLPELQRRAKGAGRRRFTLWSAGCSTGEEAYTLAILALESGLFAGWDLQVIGTDLSRSALDRARRGRYGPGAFRAVPEEIRDRYFTDLGSRWQVDAHLRRLVRFEVVNLMRDDEVNRLPAMDVILCRNVFLYFRPSLREAAAQRLYGRLHEGGILVMGNSESLLALKTPFMAEELEGEVIYRRQPPAGGRGRREGR